MGPGGKAVAALLAEVPTICRRRQEPGRRFTDPCESCGHHQVLHPGHGNRVDACVICLTLATVEYTRKDDQDDVTAASG